LKIQTENIQYRFFYAKGIRYQNFYMQKKSDKRFLYAKASNLEKIPEEWRQLIVEGLQLWERETCIRFRENSHTKDRLEFIRGGG
jgi:hypothetical protein